MPSFLVKENIIKTYAMARTRVIVGKLASFETLGYTTVTYCHLLLQDGQPDKKRDD